MQQRAFFEGQTRFIALYKSIMLRDPEHYAILRIWKKALNTTRNRCFYECDFGAYATWSIGNAICRIGNAVKSI